MELPKLTLGEIYHPAMKIEDEEIADGYFKLLVHMLMAMGIEDRARAEQTAKTNLGYWAGYFDNSVRERVERLFHCSHPVFGSIEEQGALTPEEAFRLGQEMANRENVPIRIPAATRQDE